MKARIYKQFSAVLIAILLIISNSIYGQLSNINTVQKDILKNLHLSDNEKDILNEVKEVNLYIAEWTKQVETLNSEVIELDKIINDSGNFYDIKSKAIRTKKRTVNYKNNIQYDIEEYIEIVNYLINNIYSNHNKSQNKQSIKLEKESRDMFVEAKKVRDKAYDNPNCKLSLELLIKADCIEKEALKNQERLFADRYKIETNCEYFKTNLIAEYETQIKNRNNQIYSNSTSVITESANLITDNQVSINNTECIEIEENQNYSTLVNTNMNLSENIIFKVQVGAYCNSISKSIFKGLSPISVDKSDAKYDKYMIGEYTSFTDANVSLKKVVSTTEYKDAFIVAYQNGKRLPVKKMLAYHP